MFSEISLILIYENLQLFLEKNAVNCPKGFKYGATTFGLRIPSF
jgi:hypothetical protein